MTHLNPKPRRIHFVLGDWAEGGVEGLEGNGTERVGQMPGWLDWSQGVDAEGRVLGLDGETELFVHHHSELFLRSDGGEEEQRSHTRASVPTYNSSVLPSHRAP
jgi:hypothetical protein